MFHKLLGNNNKQAVQNLEKLQQIEVHSETFEVEAKDYSDQVHQAKLQQLIESTDWDTINRNMNNISRKLAKQPTDTELLEQYGAAIKKAQDYMEGKENKYKAHPATNEKDRASQQKKTEERLIIILRHEEYLKSLKPVAKQELGSKTVATTSVNENESVTTNDRTARREKFTELKNKYAPVASNNNSKSEKVEPLMVEDNEEALPKKNSIWVCFSCCFKPKANTRSTRAVADSNDNKYNRL